MWNYPLSLSLINSQLSSVEGSAPVRSLQTARHSGVFTPLPSHGVSTSMKAIVLLITVNSTS